MFVFQNKFKIYQYEVISCEMIKKVEDTDFNGVWWIVIDETEPLKNPFNLEFNQKTSAFFESF